MNDLLDPCFQDLKEFSLPSRTVQMVQTGLALRVKRNWVCVELSEGNGKREGLKPCVIMLRAKKGVRV